MFESSGYVLDQNTLTMIKVLISRPTIGCLANAYLVHSMACIQFNWTIQFSGGWKIETVVKTFCLTL